MKRVLLFTVLATVAVEYLARPLLALMGCEVSRPCPEVLRRLAEILPYIFN